MRLEFAGSIRGIGSGWIIKEEKGSSDSIINAGEETKIEFRSTGSMRKCEGYALENN